MRISLQWLGDYLSPVPPARDAGEILTMAGYPVEEFFAVDGVDAIDVEVTSNRPDLLSHVGVARELAAMTAGSFTLPSTDVNEVADAAADVTQVAIDADDLCPHYVARIIRNVTVGPSPDWLVRRLGQVGLRSINNVVDVTNYVLFELGQPLHAFDFDKLHGGRIVVRRAEANEPLRTLDGMDRKLVADDLVIADAERPVALAGVMGGEATEVTGETTTILLETARFDPLRIRTTSRRLKLSSDSSHRFERGLDPTLPHRAGDRAAALIAGLAGGEVLAGRVEAGRADVATPELTVRWSEIERLLGVALPQEKVTAGLDRLGLSPTPTDGGLTCTVPTHRLDLSIEADLVEEAARVVGYDAIPTRERITLEVRAPDPTLAATRLIRETLVAAGCFEAVTFSFVSDRLQQHFLPAGASLRRVDSDVRRADGHLRPSVLPGLLEAVASNEAVGNGTQKFFEIGSVFWRNEQGPQEHRRLGLVAGDDYAKARGIVELLLNRLDADRPVRVEFADVPGVAKSAGGRVIWGDVTLGTIGLVAADVVAALELRHTPVVVELDAEALVAGHEATVTNRPLPRFPSARRDVSFVVKESVSYGDLSNLATSLDLADLLTIEHGGTYRGKPLEAGTKSVTLTLVFRREDGTVPREEADAQVDRFATAAQERFDAQLRT
jgi:phenylalanyl-tRNA synthetase beta chain